MLAAFAAALYVGTRQQQPITLCTPLTVAQQKLNNQTLTQGVKAAFYDEQLLMGISSYAKYLSYNVTAIAQNDSFGYGPGYLLNGLSDKNVWYQVGLAWNWVRYNGTNFNRGFRMITEIWNATTGKPIWPPGGGSQLFNFTKPVLVGDRIALSLNITSHFVDEKAFDFRDNISESLTTGSYNASQFVSSKGPEGYPTSVMTEWYHVLPYFCSNQEATYSNKQSSITSAWLEIDEWNFTGLPPSQWFNASIRHTLFNSIKTPISLSSGGLYRLNSNGTQVYCNSSAFITM